ncbi:hypothetical protein KKG83_03730 [Candidatus Micrarchaeota archaeon]|nr:hypothetical protein [Candidatus Micrarchaeota archaeon]MBU2476555.1 hypothetical protein [Candidatus Micrarchaeota archaeon]
MEYTPEGNKMKPPMKKMIKRTVKPVNDPKRFGYNRSTELKMLKDTGIPDAAARRVLAKLDAIHKFMAKSSSETDEQKQRWREMHIKEGRKDKYRYARDEQGRRIKKKRKKKKNK